MLPWVWDEAVAVAVAVAALVVVVGAAPEVVVVVVVDNDDGNKCGKYDETAANWWYIGLCWALLSKCTAWSCCSW